MYENWFDRFFTFFNMKTENLNLNIWYYVTTGQHYCRTPKSDFIV